MFWRELIGTHPFTSHDNKLTAALLGPNATLPDTVTVSGSVAASMVVVNLVLQAKLLANGGEEVEEQADVDYRES